MRPEPARSPRSPVPAAARTGPALRAAAYGLRATVLAAAALLASHCILDDRQAGTSTTVTNPSPTIHGAAILQDGRKAAGARVFLRSTAYRLGSAGAPEAVLVSETVADDTGGFSLPMPPLGREHYLAFRQADGGAGGISGATPEVQLRRWEDGLPPSGWLATFRLWEPGEITGRLVAGDTSADSVRYVGVRGTDNFAAVSRDGAFALTGVAPGAQHLTVITTPAVPAPAGAPRAFSVIDKVKEVEVKSGEAVNAGDVGFTGS